MNLEVGKIFTWESREALGIVPREVQAKMFEGGRLRCVRYDGGENWHVFNDQEMAEYQEAIVRSRALSMVAVDEGPVVKLDLGCGKKPREGFEGVDLISNESTHKVDLFKFPFPWADESVDQIHTSHFIEHIPNREIEQRDLVGFDPRRSYSENETAILMAHQKYIGQDMLLAFFDECWRMLKHMGTLNVVCPNARSDGAFQDPTHRRFPNQNTFWYLNAKKRTELDVDHYRCVCDFEYLQMTPAGPSTVDANLVHPEVLINRFNHEWNRISDWHVLMRKPNKNPLDLPVEVS